MRYSLYGLALLLACDRGTEAEAPQPAPAKQETKAGAGAEAKTETKTAAATKTATETKTETKTETAPPPPPPAAPPELWLPNAPSSPAKVVPQKRVVYPGGNAATDAVGLVLAANAAYWKTEVERAPLHIEGDRVVYRPDEHLEWGSADSNAALVRVGTDETPLVLPEHQTALFVDDGWILGAEDRLLVTPGGKAKPKALTKVAGPISFVARDMMGVPGLAVFDDSVYALHARPLTLGDDGVDPSEIAEAEAIADHALELGSMAFAEARVITKVPLAGGEARPVVDESREITMWAVGGASTPVLAWHVGSGEHSTGGRTEELPEAIRVVEVGSEAGSRDVYLPPETGGGKSPISGAETGPMVLGLAVDQSHVYWFEARAGDIVALCRSSWTTKGPVEDLARAKALCGDCRPLIHDGHVLWGSGEPEILRVPVDGGAVERLQVSGTRTPQLAATPREAWAP